MDDTPFLKALVVVVTMIAISALAQTDENNPLVELGIPFGIESFNIYTLGSQAPQLPIIDPPSLDAGEGEKLCWIPWWCPDLPTDAVARAITYGVTVFYNFIAYILNAVLWGGTVIVLLILNFLTLFNFASWAVFQGHVILLTLGVILTIFLGGIVSLWIYSKVTGSIPFVGGV
ncbi:MAG: hypothetical protein GTO14_07660 [Anaerolineales bacterium]|nr:hypothetical protein [Anaerolineales bacterium]